MKIREKIKYWWSDPNIVKVDIQEYTNKEREMMRKQTEIYNLRKENKELKEKIEILEKDLQK